MFGPNTHILSELELNFSHRDEDFFTLYKEVQNLFKDIFKLHNYELIFINGSGTVGVEAIIKSINRPITMIGNDGKFKRRWDDIISQYDKDRTLTSIQMFSQLETSNSSIFSREDCIVDAISSFPFYNLPNNTKAFITCPNKLIGSFPGLSIVGINKNDLNLIDNSTNFSYLNLNMYLEYSKNFQLPTTAPIQLFKHLKKVLTNFNLDKLRNKVTVNSIKLVNKIGEKNIIGEKICPVITFRKDNIPLEIAKKYQLYGINSDTDNYQIFTYSTDDKLFNTFINEI